MKYARAVIDELAAQYVLGMLRGRARRRMERICRQDAGALRAVREWEELLSELADQAAPVQPPAAVLQNVRAQLNLSKRTRNPQVPRWRSRTWLALAASIAVLALALTWFAGTQIGTPRAVANITDQQQTRLWRIEAVSEGGKLRINAETQLSLDPSHAYELWALSDSGEVPVSLGLMPLMGSRVLPLSAGQRSALARARQLAVSREPLGGSPTGEPTGPVLFVASVIT